MVTSRTVFRDHFAHPVAHGAPTQCDRVAQLSEPQKPLAACPRPSDAASGRGRVDGATEATVAAGVLFDRRPQGAPVDVGPQHILEDHLGIG